jgi:hypothetical protein
MHLKTELGRVDAEGAIDRQHEGKIDVTGLRAGGCAISKTKGGDKAQKNKGGKGFEGQTFHRRVRDPQKHEILSTAAKCASR